MINRRSSHLPRRPHSPTAQTHVLESEWFHGDEAYRMLQRVSIDPIPLESDVVCRMLGLPARHSGHSPNRLTEGALEAVFH